MDKALGAFSRLNIPVYGFGAPRNSLTENAADRLIEWNLEYDGSVAYDPMTSFLDAAYQYYDGDVPARIISIPYISPNDYDARFEMKLTARQMAEAWKARLDRVLQTGEPSFVLDLHQWIACRDDNLAAVRDFIRYAKSKPKCRLVTFREAARRVRSLLDTCEIPCPTSGTTPPPFAHPPQRTPAQEKSLMRPLLNILLGLAYLFGFMVVWISLEMLAFDRREAAPAILGLLIGVGWWSFLTWLGKRFTHRLRRGETSAS